MGLEVQDREDTQDFQNLKNHTQRSQSDGATHQCKDLDLRIIFLMFKLCATEVKLNYTIKVRNK